MRNIVLFFAMAVLNFPFFAANARNAQQDSSELATVPIISALDFKAGKSWTWDYFEPSNQLYSSERYEVIEVLGSEVTLEMSSAYVGKNAQLGKYTAHHRILVDLKLCQAAYRTKKSRRSWDLRMFALQSSGKWLRLNPGTTLAFEEKFNCNPHVIETPRVLGTEFDILFEMKVFRQKSWSPNSRSWFLLEGHSAGVLLSKIMGANPDEAYRIQLRQ
jgi:hypothetical protein